MMEDHYKLFIRSSEFLESGYMSPCEIDLAARLLLSLTPEEMERLVKLKEAQKLVDAVLSTL